MYTSKVLSPGMMHVTFLLMLLVIKTVISDVRCEKSASLTTNCNYRKEQVKTISGLDIPNDCQALDLSINSLASVDDFVFGHLSRLLSLDLSFNQITSLEPKAFFGLSSLTCLHLNNNPLSYANYPEQIFHPLGNLKVLDIGQGIEPISPDVTYPDIALSPLGALEELYMDMFSPAKFGPGFTDLRSLKTLSADRHYCSIDGLFNDTFKVFENSSVTTLNLAKCNILSIEPMTFYHLQHLQNLNIRGNNDLGLTAALACLTGLVGRNLTSLDISQVNSGDSLVSDLSLTKDKFQILNDICVKSLDLSDNMLVRFDTSALVSMRHPDCLEEFRFKNFYLHVKVYGKLFAQMMLRFRNLRHVDITGALLQEARDLPEVRLSRTRRTVPGDILNHYMSLPPRLTFLNASHVWFDCALRPQWRMNFLGLSHLHTVDMSYSTATNCFEDRFYGLEYVQVLNISGNDYSKRFTHAFVDSFPNLTSLVARDTNLDILFKTSTADQLFRGLTRLQHLDLANSGITNIPDRLLREQKMLLTLDTGYNKLSEIPKVIYSLNNLQHLDMRFNVLSSISARNRKLLDSLVKRRGEFSLFLNGNPFTCNCETFDFVEWIWTSNIQFDNHENYRCVLQNGSLVSMLKLRSTLNDLKIQCVSSFWIVFGALGAFILVLTLLGAAVGYRYRVSITYWCITLCKKPEAKPEQRHKYDALIAYCHEDYEWVCHILQPTLEKDETKFSYKVCIYDRDFLPGLAIEENVVNAINSSFKTVLVITPAFVRSAWCRFEIQMARMKMIQEGRQDVIIPVILQDVPVSAMPKTLLNLWNTSVFLVWSESPAEQRHFWDKLTTALGPTRVGEHTDNEERHGHDRELEEVMERDDEIPLLP